MTLRGCTAQPRERTELRAQSRSTLHARKWVHSPTHSRVIGPPPLDARESLDGGRSGSCRRWWGRLTGNGVRELCYLKIISPQRTQRFAEFTPRKKFISTLRKPLRSSACSVVRCQSLILALSL